MISIYRDLIFNFYLRRWYQFLQKIIFGMALQILGKKSQLLAVQFLLLFIQVIVLYLFHILQHTECSSFIVLEDTYIYTNVWSRGLV